jgi:hypothetical protein
MSDEFELLLGGGVFVFLALAGFALVIWAVFSTEGRK